VSILNLSSQVLGIAVARTNMSQLGYEGPVRFTSEVIVGRAGASVGVEVTVVTTTLGAVTVAQLTTGVSKAVARRGKKPEKRVELIERIQTVVYV
jgi:hypothetical protein